MTFVTLPLLYTLFRAILWVTFECGQTSLKRHQGRVTQVCHHQIIGFLCLWPCGAHRAATSSCNAASTPRRMPNNLDDLRQLIDADAVEPARRGSYCVQFAGSGHYFDERADALAYLCKRWRGSFITKHLEDACALAATRQPAAW